MFDGIAGNFERYMSLLGARQKLVASNIANADTPGYRTRDIDFQAEYQSQIDSAGPAVIEPDGLPTRNDGNNVNLDRESRLLAENALRYNMASTLARAQIRIIRSAIQEGKSS